MNVRLAATLVRRTHQQLKAQPALELASDFQAGYLAALGDVFVLLSAGVIPPGNQWDHARRQPAAPAPRCKHCDRPEVFHGPGGECPTDSGTVFDG